jgi:hypothetical protein
MSESLGSSDHYDPRKVLLIHTVELLIDELALVSSQDWAMLPELKKSKTVVASKLRRMRAETEAADGAPIEHLEDLISDLEIMVREQLVARLELVDKQLFALKDLSLYLRESFFVKLGRSSERSASNGAII